MKMNNPSWLVKAVCFFLSIFVLCAIAPVYAKKPDQKEWTFMVFMNGNNNLDEYGKINIKQMEQVGSNDQMNIVVQYASYATRQTQRIYIEKSTDPDVVTSPVMQELGQVDMGDYHSLEDFIQWTVQNYPAKHYFIVVWNHGSGWNLKAKQRMLAKQHLLTDISYDDFTNHVISTKELGQSMTYAANLIGHKVDIYGSDACLMSMIEVADEMADAVKYFVGSEDYEPGMGWPYGKFLAGWQANKLTAPKDILATLVHDFVVSFEDGSNDKEAVTLSAFDLRKIVPVENALNALSSSLVQSSDADLAKIHVAMNAAQIFGDDGVDLLDMLKQLDESNLDSLKPQVATLRTALNDFIVSSEATPEYGETPHGLAIWMPSTISAPYIADLVGKYQLLIFDNKTHWSNAINAVVNDKSIALPVTPCETHTDESGSYTVCY